TPVVSSRVNNYRFNCSRVSKLASSAPMLDQFNFVTFRSIDECDGTAIAMRMGAIRERITFGRSLFGEVFQIVYFKCEMSQVRTDHDRATLVILAKLDLFLAFRCFEKNQLRAASRGVPSCFLQTKDVSVKGDGFFQVRHAITGVQ